MDWDWFIRATARIQPDYLPIDLARFRFRPEIKSLTGGRRRAAEVAEISRRYGGRHQPTYMMYRFQSLGWALSSRLGTGRLSSMVEVMFALTAWLVRGTVWRRRCLL